MKQIFDDIRKEIDIHSDEACFIQDDMLVIPSSWMLKKLDEAEAKLESERATTEAEIRASAIDEFAEKLCDVFSEKYGEVTVNGIKFDVLTLDGATEITWEVAEQLKEE